MEIASLYDVDAVRELGGIVDYTVGPSDVKIFCLAEHSDPKQRRYLELYKLGEGPLYPFWIPYHLPHFETPNAIARVALLDDNVAPPLAGPVVEVCAVAKRDLKTDEVLDEYGMYMTYGEATNVDEMSVGHYLPEGLVEGCRLRRDVSKDQVLTCVRTSTFLQDVSPTGSARNSTATSVAKPGSKSFLRRKCDPATELVVQVAGREQPFELAEPDVARALEALQR